MLVRIPAEICLSMPDYDEAEMLAILEPMLKDLEHSGWDEFVPRTIGEDLPEECEMAVVWLSSEDRQVTVIDWDGDEDDIVPTPDMIRFRLAARARVRRVQGLSRG